MTLRTSSVAATILSICAVGALNAGDCVPRETVKGEAPSLLPAGRNFKLIWNDEFNGTRLDTSKWSYRTNFWGRRAHWFAAPEDNAVEVKDGKVHLKIVRKDNGQFVSPQLQTGEIIWDIPHNPNAKNFWPLPKREKPKFTHRYGYYECRCRFQQMDDWWSAFWMQSEMQGTSLDPVRAGIEHDIMECFVPGVVTRHMFHYNGYGADHASFSIPYRPKGEDVSKTETRLDKAAYHTFGLLWEPDGYTVFIDGVQHERKAGGGVGEYVSQTEEFILISTECKNYRSKRMTGTAAPGLEAAADRADDAYIGEQWKKYLLLSDAGREMVDVMLNAVYARERDQATPPQ